MARILLLRRAGRQRKSAPRARVGRYRARAVDRPDGQEDLRLHPRHDRRHAAGAAQPHHQGRRRRRGRRQDRDVQPRQLDQGPHGGQDDRGRRARRAARSPAARSSRAPPAIPAWAWPSPPWSRATSASSRPPTSSRRRKSTRCKAFGAEVIVCPTNVEPEDPRSYYSVSSRLERETPNALEGQPVRQPVERAGPLRADRARDLGADRRPRRSPGGRRRHRRHDLRRRQVSQGAEAGGQGVGHRHLRLGLQEVQGDRRSSTRTRSIRTSPRASARTSCRRTSTSRSSTTSKR